MRWVIACVVVVLVAATGCDGADGPPTGGPLATRPGLTAVPGDGANDVTTPAGTAPRDTLSPTAPPRTSTTTMPDAEPEDVTPAGFDLVAARATGPDGTTCELCLWLAESGDQRRQGLMFVTDLGPGDGMAFRYPQPHTGSFWMKNTVLPLSIAFFAADGSFLDAMDMAPCTSEPCPSYSTPADFLIAVEVVQGGLDGLGMVEGSTLELLGTPCP